MHKEFQQHGFLAASLSYVIKCRLQEVPSGRQSPMLDNYGEDEFEEGRDLPSPAPAAPVAAVAQPPSAVPVTEPKVDGWRQVFQDHILNIIYIYNIYIIYIYIIYIYIIFHM